jgi:phosphate transport system protein
LTAVPAPPPTSTAPPAGPLAELEAGLLEALDALAVGLECAVEALERQDVDLARLVVCDDDYTDARYVEANAGVLGVLSQRSLDEVGVRIAMALLQASRHVERIGDLCVNLAKLVLLDGPAAPADATMLERIGRMGYLAHQQLWQARVAFAERDVELARDLASQDQQLDELNRACFHTALRLGADAERRPWAMHMMLAARWLERIGDNAVDVGAIAGFIVTGEAREFHNRAHARAPRR